MASAEPMFSTDEILWYDNGKWGEAGYAIANPNGKTWTNNSMLTGSESIWAVALPVTLRYEGDAQPGMSVQGHVFADSITGGNGTCSDDEATARLDDRLGGR